MSKKLVNYSGQDLKIHPKKNSRRGLLFCLVWIWESVYWISDKLVDFCYWSWVELKYFITKFWLVLVCLSFFFGAFGWVGYQNLRTIKADLLFQKQDFKYLVQGLLQMKALVRDQNLDQIESRIEKSLEPIKWVPFVNYKLKSDVSTGRNLLAKWLNLGEPLMNYRFTENGFIPQIFLERSFTNDLDTFLTSSPDLMAETRNFVNSLWIYGVADSGTKQILEILDQVLNTFENLQNNKKTFLTMLGHYGSQKMVVFNQNTGEARPTGGFIGSYIPIDIFKGQVKIGQSQSIYYPDGGPNSNLVVHPATWYYGWPDTAYNEAHGIRNLNFFPCFRDSVSLLAAEFERRPNAFGIDQILFVSPKFLIGLLPDDFSFTYSGETVFKNNLLDFIEKQTSGDSVDKANPKKELTPLLSEILNSYSSPDPILLFQKLQNLTLNREVQYWAKNTDIDALALKNNWTNRDNCQDLNPRPVITPLIANLSGDKRNILTDNKFEIVSRGNKVYIRYRQSLDKPAEVFLNRPFNRLHSISFVGLQIPKSASNLNISSPQALILPFLKSNYLQDMELKRPNYYSIQPEIQKLIDSSRNLNEVNNPAGFTYDQPDGSQVLGIYVKDDPDITVEFSFELDSHTNPVFLPQSGLKNLSIKRL